MIGLIIIGVVTAFVIAGFWQMLQKAGQPGWAALIPIYNLYVLTKVAKVSGWNLVLLIIPIVNIYAVWVINNRLAKSFGKGIGFTLGLICLFHNMHRGCID